MQFKLNDNMQVHLIEMVRKKLKASGVNPLLLNSLSWWESEQKLIIFFESNDVVQITSKAEKNLVKEIADYLFTQKVCRKYNYSEVKLEFIVNNPSSSQALITALKNLTPNSKTDNLIVTALKLLLDKGEPLRMPVLVTIISDYLWPELCGTKIEQLYLSEKHQLEPLRSIESNAYKEFKFIYEEYSTLITTAKHFTKNDIIPFCHSELPSTIQSKLELATQYLVKLHQLEFKLTCFWEWHEYLLSRLTILRRVCSELNDFHAKSNIFSHYTGSSLLQECIIYQMSASGYDDVIQKTIRVFCTLVQEIKQTIEQGSAFLYYSQSICKQENEKQKQLNNDSKVIKKTVSSMELGEPIESNFKNLNVCEQSSTQLSTETKEAKVLANLLLENKERKRILKEEKKLSALNQSVFNQEEHSETEVNVYHLCENQKEIVTFSLDDIKNSNLYVINSKLKFYALTRGLIQLSSEFQQVLQNKEDRNFLAFNCTGKTGLKLLRGNIIVIKPKATSERMLLVGITKNENRFFLPAVIINHKQWEYYASGQYPEELDALTNKISSIFSIDYAVNSLSSNNLRAQNTGSYLTYGRHTFMPIPMKEIVSQDSENLNDSDEISPSFEQKISNDFEKN